MSVEKVATAQADSNQRQIGDAKRSRKPTDKSTDKSLSYTLESKLLRMLHHSFALWRQDACFARNWSLFFACFFSPEMKDNLCLLSPLSIFFLVQSVCVDLILLLVCTRG